MPQSGDEGVWKQHQEFISETDFRYVAIDGQLALVTGDIGTVGYVLQRGTAADSWEFIARLIIGDE